ncbi:hypothetical protein D9757_010640 [Collybiopsis confluens]|uniref:Uncharacterized protein n=1 Tax=Collybiopsis confluens TaxID=2823264 RepID=A0A8H5GMQ3_9AGAR|nr:hypothetical protein D9757_010640 [Collybiopsis confluens]
MAMSSPTQKYLLAGTACLRFPAETDSISIQLKEAGALPEVGQKNSEVDIVPEEQRLGGTNFSPKCEPAKATFQKYKAKFLFRAWQRKPWYAVYRQAIESESAGLPTVSSCIHRRLPVHLYPEDTYRWTLAFRAMQRYRLQPFPPTHKPYVVFDSTLQSHTDYKERSLTGLIRSNLAALGLTLIYGFPHILGWNAHFPTAIEKHLWRIATVAVTVWGTAMTSIVIGIVVTKKGLGLDVWNREGETPLVASAGLLYLVCACFLLFESLRQLFYLTPAAYQLASWSNYWPYFS